VIRDCSTPPARAERLLAAVFGSSEWSESILGDLYEEYAALANRSTLRANVWYWIQALRLITRAALRRTRRPHPVQQFPLEAATRRNGDSFMRTIGLETRHAVRAIVKRPSLSAIVIVTLALGLGANASVFSMIDALVLRPFTMRDAGRVTLLTSSRPDDLNRRETVSPADFLDWKQQTDVFDRLAAFGWWDANLVGRDEPEKVQGFHVSADFFPVLGVEPAIGRGFLKEEEQIGHERRVILGYGLWQRRFAGDRAIVGSGIEIDGTKYEVVGIAPEGFDFPMGSQLWAPLAFDAQAAANRGSHYLTVIGHLRERNSLEDAKAQMAVVAARLEREHPDTNRGRDARVYTLAEGMMDLGVGPILSMWQASACFVLLIACANVANLLLARGAERQREMAVRVAMGASRGRVVRELLIESGLLALAAVPAALAVAWAGLKMMTASMPAKIARFVAGWYEIDVDGRLVFFTVALALGTALVFGLMPAFQASRPRLAESLKEGGRSSTAGGTRLRLRRSLVVAEMALALPLLVASALSVVTVQRFLNGPQGYEPDHLLTMQLVLASGRYPDAPAYRRFADDAVDRLRQIAGVQGTAAINVMPSGGNNSGRTIEIDGQPNPDPSNPPDVDYRVATPDVFSVLQVPILRGRSFSNADREDTQPVAIVTHSLAQRYFANVDPIGQRIRVGANGRWLTIVGVAGDVIHDWFARRNYPTLYRPFLQAPDRSMALLLRTAGDPAAIAADARAAVRAVDPAQAVFDLRPMRETLKERTLGLQFLGATMSVLGCIALVLAVVGVYGVMAYMVTQRRHEIGVRMALGATRRDVLTLAFRQTATLTAVGVAAGIGLSFALGRLIEAGLLGITPNSPGIVGGLALVLVLAALAAGYLPARRAASTDPMIALRSE
jgi:putative ABC transport system permease protein